MARAEAAPATAEASRGAARGASLRTARELFAERFPSPDVPSRIRKLPERLVASPIHAPVAVTANAANAIPPALAEVANARPAAVVANARPAPVADLVATPGAAAATAYGRTSSPRLSQSSEVEHGSLAGVRAQSLLQAPSTPAEPPHPLAQAGVPSYSDRPRIEPLSAERYRIVFTGDACLKQKLELARDLLRHAHPSGDLAPIVSRALDLLLQELLQRRFGARRKDTPHRSTRPATHAAPTAPAAPPSTTLQSSTRSAATPAPAPAPPVAAPGESNPPAATPCAATPASPITRAARRVVLERDGLGCHWVDQEGNRCGSTAWLELDHHHPAGKGGGSEPENLRLLCRAHNRFAAERAYGRDHVERAIQARQRSTKRRRQNGQPPSSTAPV